MKLTVKIEYLCDDISYADIVAKWVYDEFIEGIKHGVSYEDVLSSVKDCEKDKLPICLIALSEDICAGTVSIVYNDLKCRDYTPWLSSLYVDKAYRNNKLGVRLIEHVKQIVKDLGYGELYLRTEHASDYYRKLDWQFIETCNDDFNLKPDVFKWTF